MSNWVVPGSPLEGGWGWRIWYSRAGVSDFRPAPVTVRRGGIVEPTREDWRLLAAVPGLGRRMGVLTVSLAQTSPGREYQVDVNEPGVAEFRWRSLPDSLLPDGVTFLLASCFWRENDKEGYYPAAVRALPAAWRPAFKLLVGDQVYCDWPLDPRPDFTGSAALGVYARAYEAYWGDDAYREALGVSPNFFLCDDHEFWNDYPERQLHLRRSWADVRDRYSEVAQTLYESYQRASNPGGGRWFGFRIGRVSFFAADTRSQRDFHRADGTARFIQDPQWDELERWGRSLTGPGILVLGQPIFQKDGDWRDHSLSNFADDYSRLWAVVERAVEGRGDDGHPHDVLILSGDIHTGRIAVGRRPDKAVHELIASPAAVIKPGGSSPVEPDYRFPVGRGAARRTWTVDRDPFMTLDNNLLALRLGEGTNGRVRVEIGVWRIRPRDTRGWWQRVTGRRQDEGPFRFLEGREIELR